MAITDEKLVQNFLGGDEKALEELIDRYLKPIFGFIFQLIRDKSIAEDIVQEVFVKVWRSIIKFDETKKFSTWIFAIAKNAAYDYLRKKKAIPFSTFENEQGNNILDNLEDETILHSVALLQKMDDVKDTQQFLGSLSPQLKTILLLHHAQGFSLVEIAQIMGSPANTIKSKHRRALILLRSLYSSKDASNKVAPETFPAS